MKRTDLLRHLEKHDCIFIRKGENHTIYKNSRTGRMTAIPRHREVKEFLVKKICGDLEIPRL
ncbi:MAG: type II toxin-antitoxin system HicA family toxin [Pyrinomonadaceae bacterium]|nr:type II toxin-antitoxin system HicA family toxin [Pyrinomonadaceae bacterium]